MTTIDADGHLLGHGQQFDDAVCVPELDGFRSDIAGNRRRIDR
jgi:hypothetical protein